MENLKTNAFSTKSAHKNFLNTVFNVLIVFGARLLICLVKMTIYLAAPIFLFMAYAVGGISVLVPRETLDSVVAFLTDAYMVMSIVMLLFAIWIAVEGTIDAYRIDTD